MRHQKIFISQLSVATVNGTLGSRRLSGENNEEPWWLSIHEKFYYENCLAGSSSNEVSGPAHIFKLDKDSLMESFDYLSLRDLTALAKTCKKLLQAAGEFFGKTFSGRIYGQNGSIFAENDVELNCFSKFVHNVRMKDGNLKMFQSKRFLALKQIEFYGGKLFFTENIKDILPNVEILKFILSEFDMDLHETFLSHCKNLKRLYVGDNLDGNQPVVIGTSNSWLTKKYPTIEHFEINSQKRINGFVQFLKINPNIGQFSCNIGFLLQNMDSILKSNIKMNDLAIFHAATNINEAKFNAFANNLLALHKRKFFQQLRLYFYQNSRAYNYPSNLMPHITKMHITNEPRQFNLSTFLNLELLCIESTSQINDLNEALSKFTKLNYIYILNETIANIFPFIRHLKKLNKIKIRTIKNGLHFNDTDNVLNLSALNDERQSLPNACNITFYVDEVIYLATRIAFKTTTLSSIAIKRHESYSAPQDFC